LKFAPWFLMGSAVYFVPTWRWLPPWGYGLCLGSFVVVDLFARRFLVIGHALWAERGLGVVFCFMLPHFREIASATVQKICHLIAKYSYGIYLAHVSVMWFAFRYLGERPLAVQLLVFAGLMIPIPVLLFHLIENPFMRLGRRLASAF